MYTCTLRLNIENKRKEYHFESVAAAAVFQNKFEYHCGINKIPVSFEVLYKDIADSKKLSYELTKDPENYAVKEFLDLYLSKMP